MSLTSKIHSLLKSRSIQNSAWIIGQQCFQVLLQLIVGVLTARYLGPSNYGSLNYTASFVAFFTSIASLGMDGVVIKKMIDYPDKEGVYLGSAMGFRLLSSMLSIVSVSIIVYVLNPAEPIKLLLVFVQSFQLSFKAVQILNAWFQRYLRSKYVSIGKMLACVIVSAYKFFLLATAKSIFWFAFSNALTELVIAGVEIFFYRQSGGPKLKFDFKIGKNILADSYHFIISGLMVAIFGQMDKIMIGQVMTDADVGFYTTAAQVCTMWIFVPTAIISSFQPIIMEHKKNGNEQLYIQKLQQVYSFIIWLCIFVSAGIALLANPIVNILYGSAFGGAVKTLQILIWCETFSMIGTARGIWILCEKKNKYTKYYLFIGAIVNLVLNAIWIPIIGINGAAYATLITQVVTSLLAPLLFKETRVHTKIVLQSFVLHWYWKKEKKHES